MPNFLHLAHSLIQLLSKRSRNQKSNKKLSKNEKPGLKLAEMPFSKRRKKRNNARTKKKRRRRKSAVELGKGSKNHLNKREQE